MYIGELSKRTGLSVKAIRLYEEKGLVKPPLRVGRYRVYQESDIEVFNWTWRLTDIFQLINRALKWLHNNSYANPIMKWETKEWGEIPADFGRK